MSSVDPGVMKLGQESYMICMACHGANGEGVPNVGPPLAGSEWVTGPQENLIRMQFRGLMGPITVKGEEWNLVMAPNAAILQTDEKIASVLTYIRNSWGNEASVVSPEDVASFRGEMGKPMLTVADLIDPKTVEKSAPVQKDTEKKNPKETGDSKEVNSGVSKPADKVMTTEVGTAEAVPVKLEDYPEGISMGGIVFGVWLLICLVPILLGLGARNSE